MGTTSQTHQNVMLMVTGGALVVAGMALSSRPQAVAVPPLPRADDLSAAFRQVALEATPSVVSIEAVHKAKRIQQPTGPRPLDEDSPLRQFYRNDPQLEEMWKNRAPRTMNLPPRKGLGSGFIINSNGTILTNNHVIRGADEVKVRLHDGREFVATDVKSDPRTDVAIVRIDAPDLKPIRLGDSLNAQVGDWVLAIGSPFGLDMTVTAGIISAKGRNNRITERADFLQTDAAINPGNSGGPLINMHGEVIGINTAIATESGGYDGIGFAIPTHIAGWVSEQLITNGEVKRGYLGTQIHVVDARIAKQFNLKLLEGTIVQSVMAGSPAEKAGLEPSDVIVRLDAQKIDTPAALQGVVEQLTIGKAYPLEIIRNGKPITLNVTIDTLPKDVAVTPLLEPIVDQTGARFDRHGMQLKTLTKELARQFAVSAPAGVIITAVKSGGVADQAGIKPGDVIEKVGSAITNSIEDYEKAREDFSGAENLVLTLRSANGRRFFVLIKST